MSGTVNNCGYKVTEDKVMEKKDIRKVEKMGNRKDSRRK
jgi:hypothetical protein